jgi:ABC-type uncharacterized transport system fused permease/ATPase subunit
MYRLLDEIPGLTYISVGHRPSLVRYHNTKLRMLDAKTHIVEEIAQKDQVNAKLAEAAL